MRKRGAGGEGVSSLGGAGGKICGKKSSVRRLCRVQCNFLVCDFFFSLSLSLSLSPLLPLLLLFDTRLALGRTERGKRPRRRLSARDV